MCGFLERPRESIKRKEEGRKRSSCDMGYAVMQWEAKSAGHYDAKLPTHLHQRLFDPPPFRRLLCAMRARFIPDVHTSCKDRPAQING